MGSLGTGLVADIGGTNARFALIEPDGRISCPWRCLVDDHASMAQAIEVYLAHAGEARPRQAALAVAGPVIGDQVTMTNHPWSFSIQALAQSLGFDRLRVVNDFVANALAIPHLTEESRAQIGEGVPVPGASIGVIGPGSGLGVSALAPSPAGLTPVEGEGGHVTMSPADERESLVIEILRRRYGHVSAERVLSGPGLVNIYSALCEAAGAVAHDYIPEQISDPSILQKDARAGEALAMFCAMLGTVAGNLALTLGARGGVYIAGGIVPRLGDYFERSQFRRRFESKGRFEAYLKNIPTYVVTHPALALLGAGALLG
ncbi:glucokinase [Methylocystis heyeri]|uniref:Glucokinase n=1 Tax=Methylocystis heyeri TaxID=391905 RepID=A0A6B8KL36_9HYPH|nr:glucokinase [Methylocystis heyeri]QGM47480.1 glucokinase [Methylocystis heyeri]